MREVKFRAWDKDHFVYMGLKGAGWSFSEPFDETAHAIEWQQHTGLHDKNGKEIYEGDIVRDNNGKVWAIAWNEGYAAFGKRDPSLGKKSQAISGLHPTSQLEVIGNIYENPDLLTQKGDN